LAHAQWWTYVPPWSTWCRSCIDPISPPLDLVYFDADVLPEENDVKVAKRLCSAMPVVRWEAEAGASAPTSSERAVPGALDRGCVSPPPLSPASRAGSPGHGLASTRIARQGGIGEQRPALLRGSPRGLCNRIVVAAGNFPDFAPTEQWHRA
jgi:hypothetical protein